MAPAARPSAFVLGARLNNTRLPGPCPGLFRVRRHLHILHISGVRRRLEGALRLSLYMDGPRRPGQGTLHCASASRDGGRRNARHAAFPAPGRPIRGCAAARHAISLLSAGISTGSGAWTRKRWIEPRRRERGALPDMAALAAAGRRALGSMGRIPAKRFAASRSASLRFDGLYIDASRSNPRTLSAPLWRIGRLRDFRAENVSQAIATSHGSEDERFDGGQRARPASRICDMRSSRPCRGRKGTFGRAQQGFIDSSIESCAGLFRLYAQRGELNHQPPIPLGSLYSGKPPCSIPEPPPFLDHKKREAVQMEQGGDFNMTSFRGAP